MGYEEDVMAAAAKLVLTDNVPEPKFAVRGMVINISQQQDIYSMSMDGMYPPQELELVVRVRIDSHYDINESHKLLGGPIIIQREDDENGWY